MIGWITDNQLSRTVLESIPDLELRHISEFTPTENSVFYGILRGSGNAMRQSESYYYIDNGYFDALYVDKSMQKSMAGKFRVVRNGMHEMYPSNHDWRRFEQSTSKFLVIPPSPYSANFYDTTPEDWVASTVTRLKRLGYEVKIRSKDSPIPLEVDLMWCDGVVAFNSMVVMRACELGKVTLDTHGVFRNFHMISSHPVYDIKKLKKFYEPRQYTLEEMQQGKIKWG